MRITRRNAQFQEWAALLDNRTKRHRTGEFLVQGVRPITLAVAHGWPIRRLLHADVARTSDWARDLLARHGSSVHTVLAPELLAELAGKDAELVAVVAIPPDDLGRIRTGADTLAVCFDRPSGPGNLGSVIRSADAFGAHGVVVTGHAADPYDPQAVRASTGSLFSVPVVRAERPADVVARLGPLTVLGSDEQGDAEPADVDLTGPVLLVVGNETHGMSGAWREACDRVLRIPMHGAASSLNAANAASVLLYEAARQRRAAGGS